MNALYLAIAIAFEVSGTLSLKYSQGLSKLWPTVWMFIFFTLSVSFLAFAVKKTDAGIGYAIWTGSGTALVAVLGILLFKEEITLLKAISILLIIAGVVGLNINGMKH